MSNKKSQKIDNLLLHKWDPIGISGTNGAEDEYSQYVDAILQIICNSDSHKMLFEYLWELETEYMGLKGNRERTEEFSKFLFNEVKNMPK